MKSLKKFSVLTCCLLSATLLAACQPTDSSFDSAPTEQVSSSSNNTSVSSDSSSSSSSPSSSSGSSDSVSSSSSAEPDYTRSLTFATNGHVQGKFTNTDGTEVTEAEEGERIYLSLTFEAGYELDAISATGTTVNQLAGRYYFDVGAEDIVVTVNAKEMTKYAITVNAGLGVKVSTVVSGSEVSSAIKGSTVIVSLSYEAKYSLKSLAIVGADGTSIRYTSLQDKVSYSFTMPEQAVTITVETEYVPETYEIAHLFNLAPEHIAEVSASIDQGSSILEGTAIEFSFTGEEGYDYRVEIYDEATQEVLLIPQLAKENNSYTGTFTMPDKNIDIFLSAWQEDVDEGITVSFAQDGEGYRAYGLTTGSTYAGSTAELYIFAKLGYRIASVTCSCDGGDATELTLENGKVVLPLTEATESIAVDIQTEKAETAAITVTGAQNVLVEGRDDMATVGSTVELWVAARTGYRIDSIIVTDGEGEAVASTYENNVLSFVMPASGANIAITAVSYVDFQVGELPEGITNVRFRDNLSNDITGAEYGAQAFIFMHVDESKVRVDRVMVGESIATRYGGVRLPEGCNCAFMFTVGYSGVVSISVTQRHGVSFSESLSHVSVLSYPSSTPAEGETVSFRLRPDVGYRLSRVFVDDESVEVKEDAASGAGVYSFTMPDHDVVVSAETEECATGTLSFTGTGYTDLHVTDQYGATVSAGQTLNVGDVVSFGFNSKNGYSLGEVTVNGEPLVADEEGKYTFTVAETNEVEIDLVRADSYAVTALEANEGDSSHYDVSFTDDGYELDDGEAFVGHEVVATVTLKDTLTTLTGIEVTTESGEEVESEFALGEGFGTVAFTMPDEAVKVKPIIEVMAQVDGIVTIDLGDLQGKFQYGNSYGCLCVTPNKDVVSYGKPGEFISSGDTVESGTVLYVGTSSFYFTPFYVTVTGTDSGTVILDHVEISTSNKIVEFVMPAENVSIVFSIA